MYLRRRSCILEMCASIAGASIRYSGLVHFRIYEPADFEALYAIEESCFEPPLRFPRRYMRQLLTSHRTAAWLAEEERGLAGFAIVEWLKAADGSVAYIETIEVSAEFRGRGVGSELLCRIEGSARAAGARSIWLHVDARNLSAIRLYEARSYRQEGREENFYGPHCPALVYSKALEQGLSDD